MRKSRCGAEPGFFIRATKPHRLGRDQTVRGRAYVLDEWQHASGIAHAVDADDVGSLGDECFHAFGDGHTVIAHGLATKRHGDHDRKIGESLGALEAGARLAEMKEGLSNDEIDPFVHLPPNLLIEELARQLGGLGPFPRRRQVGGDERSLAGNLFRQTRGSAVELFDLVGPSHRSELLARAVEGHDLKNLGAGSQELSMELAHGVRMLEGRLGSERSRLGEAAALQLQHVTSVSQNRSLF